MKYSWNLSLLCNDEIWKEKYDKLKENNKWYLYDLNNKKKVINT